MEFTVPNKIGGIGSIESTNWQYIALIYCLLGGEKMLPTTFYGNQKQPLIGEAQKR